MGGVIAREFTEKHENHLLSLTIISSKGGYRSWFYEIND